MKILHYIPSFWIGGIETLFMQWFNISKETKDIEIELLVSSARRSSSNLDDYIGNGGNVYSIEPNSLRNIYKHYRSVNDFLGAYNNFDIIHAHGIWDYYLFKKAYDYGIKVVYHAHSIKNTFDCLNISDWVWSFQNIIARKYVYSFIACSEIAGLSQFGRRPFIVLNNTIPSVNYRFNSEIRNKYREDLKLSNNTVAIGHIGRMVSDKNYPFLIGVFAEISKKIDDVQFFIVGDGPELSNVKRIAKDNMILSKINFMGLRDDIPCIMQALDGIVFPSKKEGFGIVPIEAQAASLPCVMADSIPENVVYSNYAMRLPLQRGKNYWASVMLGLLPLQRKDMYRLTKEAGFDCYTEWNNLLDIYIGIINGKQ